MVGPNVRPAADNEFPFVISIGTTFDTNPQLYHICTGALISRSHVLTSAHCVDSEELGTIQVSIGSVDLTAAEKFPVSGWLTYYDWAKFKNIPGFIPGSDIVVIKVKT